MSTFHVWVEQTNICFLKTCLWCMGSNTYNSVKLEGEQSRWSMSPEQKRFSFWAAPQAFVAMLEQSRGLPCASVSLLYCKANSITLHLKGGQSCRSVIQPRQPSRKKKKHCASHSLGLFLDLYLEVKERWKHHLKCTFCCWNKSNGVYQI